MRKTRRILSIILTIALMLTMVQPNIFATDDIICVESILLTVLFASVTVSAILNLYKELALSFWK